MHHRIETTRKNQNKTTAKKKKKQIIQNKYFLIFLELQENILILGLTIAELVII